MPVQGIAVGVGVRDRDLCVAQAPAAQATPRHPVPGYPLTFIPFYFSSNSVRLQQNPSDPGPSSEERSAGANPLLLGPLFRNMCRTGLFEDSRPLVGRASSRILVRWLDFYPFTWPGS